MDIEKKVMVIKEGILDEVRQQKEKMVQAEQERCGREYEEFQQRLRERAAEIRADYEKEAQRKREKIISRAVLDRKQARRKSIDRCIKMFTAELRNRLEAYSNTEDYRGFLLEAVKRSVNLLDEDEFLIELREKDLHLTEELSKLLSKELAGVTLTFKGGKGVNSGGVIVKKAAGNEIVEYTFASMLDYLKEEIAIEIQEKVFS